MTKIQKHTVALHSPRSEAAEAARAELERLEDQSPNIQSAALKGNLSAEALADHTDRVNLAKMRADTTRAAADEELGNLGDANNITDAIAELLDDPTISTTPIEDAVANLRGAIANLAAANDTRNAAISTWVTRLRELGIPDEGLTVNEDEIRIRTSGVTGTSITIGNGQVTTIGSTDEYVKHITQQQNNRNRSAIDPDNIGRADTRGRARADVTSVKTLKALGTYPAGSTLTTRTHTLGVLAQMVHNGNAELIDGTIPEPSAYTRTQIPVDTRAQTPGERRTPTTVNDDAAVERAVERAFSN